MQAIQINKTLAKQLGFNIENPTAAIEFIQSAHAVNFSRFLIDSLEGKISYSEISKKAQKTAIDFVCQIISDEIGVNKSQASWGINDKTESGKQNLLAVKFFSWGLKN